VGSRRGIVAERAGGNRAMPPPGYRKSYQLSGGGAAAESGAGGSGGGDGTGAATGRGLGRRAQEVPETHGGGTSSIAAAVSVATAARI
jgi:hypothetical protein